MRKTVGLFLLATVACQGQGDGMSSDLKADLEAAATKIEFANQPAGQAMQVVSELEQGQLAEPVERLRAPRRVANRSTGLQPQQEQAPAPEVAQEVLASATPAVAEQTPEPTPEVSSVPMVAPRPAALPVDYQGDFGRGTGSVGVGRGAGDVGIGVGDVIGVVIRGGGSGRPDHCPPPRRRPVRGPGILLP